MKLAKFFIWIFLVIQLLVHRGKPAPRLEGLCHPNNRYCQHQKNPPSASNQTVPAKGSPETGETNTNSTEAPEAPSTTTQTTTTSNTPPHQSANRTRSSFTTSTTSTSTWRTFWRDLEGTVALVDEALLLFVSSDENSPDTLEKLIQATSKHNLTLSFCHQIILTLSALFVNILLLISLKHCCCCLKNKQAGSPAAASTSDVSPAAAFNQHQARQLPRGAGQEFELDALCRKQEAQYAYLNSSHAPIYQSTKKPLLENQDREIYACPAVTPQGQLVTISTQPPAVHYSNTGVDNPAYDYQHQAAALPQGTPPPPPDAFRRSHHGYPGVRRQAPPPPTQDGVAQQQLGAVSRHRR